MEPAGFASGAEDFSFLALFLRADIVVKLVMGGLAFASVWSWAIIIDKWLGFASLRSKARRFEGDFWSGRSLDDLVETFGDQPRDPMSRVFAAAMSEIRESQSQTGSGDAALITLRDRVDRVMNLTVSRELGKAEGGLGILATIGSASPFVGLFGTVWGIMNSFRAIAISRDTNLAVVAPGIAEALFATALGLLAAVPAVVFYNKFSTDLANYATRLEGYADELSAILSRRLTERGL